MSTRDEFEKWAHANGHDISRWPHAPDTYVWLYTAQAWEVWQTAIRTEREACAKVCEQQIRRAGDGMTFYTAVGQCAAAIRTRSIQPAEAGG